MLHCNLDHKYHNNNDDDVVVVVSGRMQSTTRTALDEVDPKGAFVRKDSVYRNFIGQVEKDGVYGVEKDRYHLYVSLACPWACRCVAALYLKGLEGVVGLSVAHPTWAKTRPGDETHTGWQFKDPKDDPVSNPAGFGSFGCQGCIPDTVNGASFVRDLYEAAGDNNGKYTVPLLWDKKTKTIVNNASSDILRIFNGSMNSIASHPEIDLYPEEQREEIDRINEMVYHSINNGVYKCGFAKTQVAYDEAFVCVGCMLTNVKMCWDCACTIFFMLLLLLLLYAGWKAD